MVGAEQNSKLTVDFHESGFVYSLNGENALTLQKGFWFQLSNEDRQNANDPSGPSNAQALNRYSYVLNNPLRYIDPTGHWHIYVVGGKAILVLSQKDLRAIKDAATASAIISAIASAAAWLLAELAAAGIITLPAAIPIGVIAAAFALTTALYSALAWAAQTTLDYGKTWAFDLSQCPSACIPAIIDYPKDPSELEDNSFSCLDGPGWGKGGCGGLNGGGGGSGGADGVSSGGGGADRITRKYSSYFHYDGN